MTETQKRAYLNQIHPYADTNNINALKFWLYAMQNFIKSTESVERTNVLRTLIDRHQFLNKTVFQDKISDQNIMECIRILLDLFYEYYLISKSKR